MTAAGVTKFPGDIQNVRGVPLAQFEQVWSGSLSLLYLGWLVTGAVSGKYVIATIGGQRVPLDLVYVGYEAYGPIVEWGGLLFRAHITAGNDIYVQRLSTAFVLQGTETIVDVRRLV